MKKTIICLVVFLNFAINSCFQISDSAYCMYKIEIFLENFTLKNAETNNTWEIIGKIGDIDNEIRFIPDNENYVGTFFQFTMSGRADFSKYDVSDLENLVEIINGGVIVVNNDIELVYDDKNIIEIKDEVHSYRQYKITIDCSDI